MRSHWIGFGLLVAGCIDTSPDAPDMPPPPDGIDIGRLIRRAN